MAMVIVTGIPLGLKGVFAGCDSLPKGTVTVVREEPSGLMTLSLELKQAAVGMSAAWSPSSSATDIQDRYVGPQQGAPWAQTQAASASACFTPETTEATVDHAKPVQ